MQPGYTPEGAAFTPMDSKLGNECTSPSPDAEILFHISFKDISIAEVEAELVD